jgi:hypothetical protein
MKKLPKFAVIVSAVVVGLFFLGVFVLVGFSYLLYSTVEDWVVSRLGLDIFPARLLTTILVIALTALLPTLAWYLIIGKKRLYGALALIGIQAGICVLVYTVGRQVCFDRRTGKPLCYFADTPQGRVWSYSSGFDPVSGQPFRLYTREIRESESVRNKK